ncbi:unnamed protein product [Brachionus calyciflorus]|uniref:TFIIS central domain-containing protein n=1 Tax=Brachionus calyciflorus TaxID=104777 RepID=A0A814IRX9_9BILA|nr:unnamed protein product [Brachionus calyciflorus]
MSSPSKITKSSSANFENRPRNLSYQFRPSYLRMYDLDNKDINDAFYTMADTGFIESLVKQAKAKKSCPDNVEYIVLSDSDDEKDKTIKNPEAEKTNEKPPEVINNIPPTPEPEPVPLPVENEAEVIPSNENDSVEPKTPVESEPEQDRVDASFDEEDDLPLCRYVDKSKMIESDSEEHESEEQSTKGRDWCICKNSTNTENLKTCDKCDLWYHILCAGDEKTRKKFESGVKVSRLEDFTCLFCRNDKDMQKKLMDKFNRDLFEKRKKLIQSKNKPHSDEDKNRSSSDDETVKKNFTKKTYEEKKDAIKERLKEQTHTKLLAPSESSDKSRQLSKSRQHLIPSSKATPSPKQKLIPPQKVLPQDKKTPSNIQINKSSAQKLPQIKKPEPMKQSTNPIKTPPSIERKTKLIDAPTSSHPKPQIVKKVSTVNSSRETAKNLLRKSFEERLIHTDDIKITLDDLDNLCGRIEEEMYNVHHGNHEYNNRIKTVRINIANKNNKSFFRKVLNGSIKPDQLAVMDKNDMKDDDLKRQDEEFLRQDINGRIQQSKEINEDIILKQTALKSRKGIDDDLSTLGNYSHSDQATDLNNNKNIDEKKIEETLTEASIPLPPSIIQPVDTTSEHDTHQFDVACKICTGLIPPPVKTTTTEPSPPINDRKRKHDPDFDSDPEFESQPKFNKIPNKINETKNATPDISKTFISYPTPITPQITPKPSMSSYQKANKNEVWSGTVNLIAPDMKLHLKSKMICINDFSSSPNLLKELDFFSRTMIHKGVRELNCVKSHFINIWHDPAYNIKNYLVFKFEANMTQKSSLQPPLLKTMIEIESDQVLGSLYERLKNEKNEYHAIELPKYFHQLGDKIFLITLRKITMSDSLDANLKEKYSILTSRSSDTVLGFLVKKDSKRKDPEESDLEAKKSRLSPTEQEKNKQNETKPDKSTDKPSDKEKSEKSSNLARDPRIRTKKQENVCTNPMQEIELDKQVKSFLKNVLDDVKKDTSQIDEELNNEILSNIPEQPVFEEKTENKTENSSDDKVLSLDLYKRKRLKNDKIENTIEMPQSVSENIESVVEAENPVVTSESENFILINTMMERLASEIPIDEERMHQILINFKGLGILKGLNDDEKSKLKVKYGSVLPELVDIVVLGGDLSENKKSPEKMDEKKEDTNELYNPFESEASNSTDKPVEALEKENIEVKKSDKMPLPPNEQWQGSSKEQFVGLLKLHKSSQERKEKGLTHDLTFESKQWDLDESNFKKLDENLVPSYEDSPKAKEKQVDDGLGDDVEKENTSDSESLKKKKSRHYRNNNESSDSETCESPKHRESHKDALRYRHGEIRQKSTARKSCSGINGNIPKFKVKSRRDSDDDSDYYRSSSHRSSSKRYDSSRYHKSKY